jgi:hypothetical protein
MLFFNALHFAIESNERTERRAGILALKLILRKPHVTLANQYFIAFYSTLLKREKSSATGNMRACEQPAILVEKNVIVIT